MAQVFILGPSYIALAYLSVVVVCLGAAHRLANDS